MLTPCPHCGDTENQVFVNGQIAGRVVIWYDEDGREFEMDNDKTYVRNLGPIRCGKCGKIRKDLSLKDGKVVQSSTIE